MAQVKKTTTVTETANTPLSLILQWLTYAFWGLCGLATVALSGVTLAYFIKPAGTTDVAGGIAYPLAAVAVLLVFALLVDYFYTKREPARKTGAAIIILVVHAVLFALAAIGSFVIGVFALVNMGLDAGEDNHEALITLFTALISFVVFAALAVRTILAGHAAHIRKITWTVLLTLMLGMVVASIAGPLAYGNATRADRRIEQNLPNVVNQISAYTSEHSKLPESLKELNHDTTSMQKFIDSGLVTYKPNTKPVKKATDSDDPKAPYSGSDQHYYQLCVTYEAERKDPYGNSTYPYYGKDGVETDKDGYVPYLYSIMSHPKGDHCYKLIANGPYDYLGEPVVSQEIGL